MPRQLGNRKLGRTAPAGSLYAYPRKTSIRRFKEQVRQLTSRRAPVTESFTGFNCELTR